MLPMTLGNLKGSRCVLAAVISAKDKTAQKRVDDLEACRDDVAVRSFYRRVRYNGDCD